MIFLTFPLHWRGSIAAVVLALGLLVGAASTRAQEPRFFRIGAAATAGTFFEIGGVIASAISKPAGSLPCERGGSCGVPGLVAVAQATAGSVDNIRMVASGQIESGIVQSDIAGWAYAGTGIFANDGAMKKLRAIASLFPESLQVVVRAADPIHTLADLGGRRVSLGQAESGTLVDARLALAASGLTENDLTAEYLRLGAEAANLKDGTLDGFFVIGGVPIPAIRELAATTALRLLPIDDQALAKMKRTSPFVRRSIIPANTYAEIDTAIPSVGLHALWVVSADAPDDLIYVITRALWNEATKRLLEAHDPIGKQVRLQDALNGLSMPLHPGAKRFYSEVGLPVEDDGPTAKPE